MSKYIELGKVKEMVFNADISMAATEALYKSLNNLPTMEVSEDAVSRATLIKRWDEMSVRGRTEFDQEIMVAPSVVPSRVEGEWQVRFPYDDTDKVRTCPNCNITQSVCEDKSRPQGEWINDTRYSGWTCTNCNYHDGNGGDNYCPNCGAKMKG